MPAPPAFVLCQRRAWLVAACLFLPGQSAAQSATNGFIPQPNGIVRAVLQQPDGKVLIAGDFTTVVPTGGTTTTRNRVARFHANGTLDTAFVPSVNNGQVHCLALQADGKVLIGGTFSGANSVGTATRNRLARLDATTGAPDSLDPNANNTVRTLVVQPDGSILAGGDFNGAASIVGLARNRVARFSSTGVGDGLDPNAGAAVNVILLQPDGKILVGGDFTGTFAGATRNRLARLNADGTIDAAFHPSATGTVWTLALQADGKVLAGGDFNGAASIGGQARNRVARLDPVTGAADGYNPGATGTVRVFALQPDGKLLVGGGFNGAASIGGQARNRLARLDPVTGLADAFDPNANTGNVLALAVQADGKVLAGGEFAQLTPNGTTVVSRSRFARLEREAWAEAAYGSTPPISAGTRIGAVVLQPDGKILFGGDFTSSGRLNLVRHRPDGALDSAFLATNQPSGPVAAIAVLADGAVIVGGSFGTVGGLTRSRLAKLDATTGAAIAAFDAAVSGGNVNALAVDDSGRLLVGGTFTSIGGQARSRLARLDPVTGAADGWNPSASGDVNAIALRPDGRIVVGGNYAAVGGQSRLRLAQLDPVSGQADPFDPSANGIVSGLACLPEGKLLVWGFFSVCGGASRNVIARVDLATGQADSFNPNPPFPVYSMVAQADGRILVGGDFTSIGGQTRTRVARLEATGLADLTYVSNADSSVAGLALAADGEVYAVGSFGNLGGQTRIYAGRLNTDGAALQDLSVNRLAATWQRSGTSPEFSRVVFEVGTDGVSFAPLGSGSRIAGGWRIGAEFIPGGQNVFVRATGVVATGEAGASETRVQSTRHALLPVDTDLRVLSATRSGVDDLTIVVAGAQVGVTYRLERKLDLTVAGWDPVAGAPDLVAAANAPLQFVAPGQYALAKATFRVVTVP